MLSRVADSAFWMSRHIERAENIARIVDVNLQLMTELPSRRGQQIFENWLPVMACLGDEAAFAQTGKKPDAQQVTEFLVFDRGYPNSIAGCLAAARENARTIREQLSTEMWEQINRTHLWLASKGARQFYEHNAYEFFQRTKKTTQLFQGITDSVMHRGEGWEFIQLGKFLERADKISRMLDEEYFLVPQNGNAPSDAMAQWHAILRSCNARQTYRRLHTAVVQPIKVAELLLLDRSFPRSLIFCVHHLDESLRRLSGTPVGTFGNLAEKLSGRLLSELSFSSIEDIWRQGLHQAMDDFQIKLNAIGSAIHATHIFPEAHPSPTALTGATLPDQ